jgi:hypothetical protein
MECEAGSCVYQFEALISPLRLEIGIDGGTVELAQQQKKRKCDIFTKPNNLHAYICRTKDIYM